MKKSLFALMIGGLTIGITEFVIMGLLPDVASNLGITIPVAGHLISAYALGVVIGAPLFVVLGRKLDPKRMLLLLALMLAVFNGISMIAPSYELLLLSRFLSGLPHGAYFGVGAVVASRLAEKGKEAQSISIMFSGLTIANLIGVPFGTFIGHTFGWRYTFVLIVFVALITIILIYLWLPAIRQKTEGNLKSQLLFFRQAKAWLIIAITAIGFGGLFSWLSYIAPMLTTQTGFGSGTVPYILILAGLGMVIGNFLGGYLADRFPPAFTVCTLLLLMAADLLVVYFLAFSQIPTLIMVFFTGTIAFALVAPLQILMIQSAKGAEVIASASMQASFNIGNALGAFLGGLPLVAGYDFASPNLVGAAMAGAGAVITVFLIRKKRKRI